MIEDKLYFKSQDSVDDDCAICLEKLNDPIILKCLVHKFCRSCLLDNYLIQTLCPMCRKPFDIYDIKDIQGKPLINSIWNQIYIQSNQIGLASYHFDHNKPYISYSQPHYSWKLKSGSKPPLKKYLENVDYDPQSRTLKFTIDWIKDPFIGPQGQLEIRWEIQQVYVQNFSCIESGTRKVIVDDDNYYYTNYVLSQWEIDKNNLIETLKNPCAAIQALY